MEVDQQSAGVPDGWEVIPSAAVARPPSAGTWEDRGIAGKVWHPASGAKEGNRVDNQVLGVPPELAVTAALPVARAVAGAGATVASKAGAAAAAVGPQVAAQAKYWATKAMLTKMGVPPMIAEGIAIVASGLKKGTKVEPPAGEMPTASAPPVEPVASAPAPPAPPPAAAAPPVPPAGPSAPPVAPAPMSGPPPSVLPQAPPPDVMRRLSPATEAAVTPPPPATMGPDGLLVGRPGGNPDLPDQRALNEAALAARRAAYQATRATAAPVAPAKPMLLAAEAKAYVKLLQSGKTAKEAMVAIEAQRAFQAQMGLTTPTAAEIRFPKGMGGGLPK